VLVDKPAGLTSHDVVQRIRRALGVRAAGHTGTLDPFATGLLVVLLGRATRLARFVESQAKQYLATARLGVQTTTDDLTGAVVATWSGDVPPSEHQVRDVLATFLGTQLQQPPQFSAKRVGGVRSYRRARRGDVVELADVPVTVHAIELVEYQPPDLTFRALVSAGTYLRAIARDLGHRLGLGAHLTVLRRESIGSIRVEDAHPLEEVGRSSVVPAQAVLQDLPTVILDEAERKAVVHGRPVSDSEAAARVGSGAVALLAAGQLIGVAEAVDGWLRPTVVLETP
jgi:tRNA pseudouridine55 synthase